MVVTAHGGGVGTLPVGYNYLIEIIPARSAAMRAGTFGMLGAGVFIGGVDCVHANLSGRRQIAASFHDAFVSWGPRRPGQPALT